MTLSEDIRIIRQKSLLSQDEFADQLDVSLSTVNRWETGKARPNLAAMRRIKYFCDQNNLNYNSIEREWLKDLEEEHNNG